MVGNSPKSDINPALGAGINAIFVPHDDTWILEHEDLAAARPPSRLLVLTTFSELNESLLKNFDDNFESEGVMRFRLLDFVLLSHRGPKPSTVGQARSGAPRRQIAWRVAAGKLLRRFARTAK